MNNLDVHNLTLNEAIKVITKQIEISYNRNDSVVYVNHGFNKGTKIKNWCLKDGSKLKHVLKVSTGENEGISNFYLEINLKGDL